MSKVNNSYSFIECIGQGQNKILKFDLFDCNPQK